MLFRRGSAEKQKGEILMQKRHLLICGDVGVGKSTLIRRLLAHSRRPPYGFITKRIPITGEDGLFPVYIHPASQSESARTYGPENKVGACDRAHSVRYPGVFEHLGVKLLQAPPEGLLLMDELGFLESQAEAFCAGVLQALDGDIPVLAAVKSRDSAFLRQVRAHPRGMLYMITAENRDALYFQLLPQILRWNAELGVR